MSLEIRNPHSALALLHSRPQDLIEVQAENTSRPPEAWKQVIDLAQSKSRPVRPLTKDSGKGSRSGKRHSSAGRGSGYQAIVQPRSPVDPDQFYSKVDSNEFGLWLALDCLQDPQNLGAIFRSAAFFGVKGILLTEDRSAPMSGTAYDVASGGVEFVPFMFAKNLVRSIEEAKERGLWSLGTSEHAEPSVYDVKRERPWLLVLGNEESGLRPLVQKSCDELCSIPPASQAGVKSLNVAAACGAILSALTRPHS